MRPQGRHPSRSRRPYHAATSSQPLRHVPHELTAGEPISDLIRGLLDDSALSAAALQSLTSLRQTAELTIQPPPSALIMEAGQVAGALQNLSLRLRQRAADAQRGQLAVARSHERENALQHKLAIAERSEAAMRDEHGSLSQKLREAEAKVAQLQMSEQHLMTMENAKLHSKVRELEASLIGEKELNKQLQRALHRMASEKTADEGGAHKKAAEAQRRRHWRRRARMTQSDWEMRRRPPSAQRERRPSARTRFIGSSSPRMPSCVLCASSSPASVRRFRRHRRRFRRSGLQRRARRRPCECAP